MTRDEFTTFATPLARHGLTALAGLLAAHGLTATGNTLETWGAAALSGGLGLAWSYLEKSKLLGQIVESVPVDDFTLVAGAVTDLTNRGASPVVVAHFARALATIAEAALTPAAVPPPVVEGQTASQFADVPAERPISTGPVLTVPVPNGPVLTTPPVVSGPFQVATNPGDEVAGDGA